MFAPTLRVLRLFLISVVAPLSVSACSVVGTEGGKAYTYRAFDSSAQLVAEGTLELRYSKSGEDGDRLIRGERRIKLVANSANVGPQIGVGDIHGEEDNGYVEINLSPERKKSLQLGESVILSGQLSDDENQIEGVWRYYETEGATRQLASGTFEAIRQ